MQDSLSLSIAYRAGVAAFAMPLGILLVSCSSGESISANDADAQGAVFAGGAGFGVDANGGGAGGLGPLDGGSQQLDSAAGVVDASFLFFEGGGPSSCPTLAATSCWRQYLAEYATMTGCFSHRTRCDSAGGTGDPSRCGHWADQGQTSCTWSDGAELDHDPTSGTDTVKGPSGEVCYQRLFKKVNGNDVGTYTFGSRAYTLTIYPSDPRDVLTCPDGTSAVGSKSEFNACSIRGICCSTASPPACSG